MKTAVLLVNMGGPDSLDDVEPYLYNIFNDPFIFGVPLKGKLRHKFVKWFAGKRAPKSREIYRQIGSKSPLIDITGLQAKNLEIKLNKDPNRSFKVFPAMQYWKPLLEDVWNSVKNDFDEIVVMSLYPYYSTTTTLSISENIRCFKESPDKTPVAHIIDRFGTEPLFLKAMTEDIISALNKARSNNIEYKDLLFSAHSIPYRRIKKGDPYEKEIIESVEQMKSMLPGELNIHLSFQSKVGPVKWLGPSTSDTIKSLIAKGIRNLMVYPLGFVADNSETIYEIDIEYRKLAAEEGIEHYEFIKALNASELFTDALKKLILEKLKTD